MRTACLLALLATSSLALADSKKGGLRSLPVGLQSAPDYEIEAAKWVEAKIGDECDLVVFFGSSRSRLRLMSCPHKSSERVTLALFDGGPPAAVTVDTTKSNRKFGIVVDSEDERNCIAIPTGKRFKLTCSDGSSLTLDRMPPVAR